jgi:D-alanyl-D-alanine carboxypeptidase
LIHSCVPIVWKNSGVDEVHGRVMGSLRPFNHDWYAPGWHPSFPAIYVALPSALTFNFNQVGGTHIKNPEKRAATAMTHDLRNMNVHVTGTPGAGQAPAGMSIEESVNSKPLEGIMRDMNVPSSNFRAEVLGKVLGVDPKVGSQVIRALVPMSEVLRYSPDLRSMTSGRGAFNMEFDHYEELPPHLAEKVVKEAEERKAAQH